MWVMKSSEAEITICPTASENEFNPFSWSKCCGRGKIMKRDHWSINITTTEIMKE
jgi:hypothetical protein